MGIAGDDRELHRGIGLRSNQIGGIANKAREFVLADKDKRVGLNWRRNEIEKVLGGDAVCGLHWGGRNSDDARGPKFGGDAKSNSSTHGMTNEDGTVWNDQAACSKAAGEGEGAGFGLVGSKRTIGTAMARKIRDVDDEALRSERAREVGHDDFVAGQAVKENGSAALRIFAQAGFLDDVHNERAGAGVNQVMARGEAARGIHGEEGAEEKKENAGARENRLFMFHAEGRLRERGI